MPALMKVAGPSSTCCDIIVPMYQLYLLLCKITKWDAVSGRVVLDNEVTKKYIMADEKKEAGATVSTCILAPPASFDFRRPEEWRVTDWLSEKSAEIQVNALIYILLQEAEDIMNSFNLSDEEFESHFIPKRNVIYERAKFNLRSQLADESVDTFVTALHLLAEKCEYKSMRNELICDRLVVGLLDKRLSETLQLDATVTLETVVNKAKQTEAIRKQQLIVQKSNRDQPVEENINRISVQTGSQFSKYMPGKTKQDSIQIEESVLCAVGHLLKSTWRDVQPSEKAVELAKKTGHFGKVCRQGINPHISEIQGPSQSGNEWLLASVNGKEISSLWRTEVHVGGQVIQFKIDMGADVTVVPEQLYNKFDPRERYPKLFEGLSLMAAMYTIRLNNDVVPVSLRAPRREALPLQPKLKQEIDRLVNMGIISPMDRPTEWYSGIVIVLKQSGHIRLCVDFTALNTGVQTECTILPDDSLAQLRKT
ncbi:hypothetical protein PR048_020560 [Dryococelus australis]|uniref:Peptidase A2 domain-containing protein n=1 Tax=Dryococelus australis TaxID=614101 RepID=A0ABQ9H6M0_9NEOP|nr:hypothetical protein PR048_020560 [Dryococelus australis]